MYGLSIITLYWKVKVIALPLMARFRIRTQQIDLISEVFKKNEYQDLDP